MKVINKLPAHYIEHEFFGEMLTYFDAQLFKDKIIYITHDNKNISATGGNVIVIQTAGNERAEIPQYHNRVKLVFKHHLDADKVKNTYHIPLITCQGFKGTNAIPILERRWDIAFTGHVVNKRREACEWFKKLAQTTKHKFFLKFSDRWAGGLPMKDYSELMSQTKIALSPSGAVRCECLRFSEAVKCGCAIIACPHPPLRVFKNTPAIYTNDWQKLPELVESLLVPEKLVEISNQTKACWDAYFSPRAVATYINKIVGSTK